MLSFEEYQNTEGFEEIDGAAKTVAKVNKDIIKYMSKVCEVPTGKEFYITTEGDVKLRKVSRRGHETN